MADKIEWTEDWGGSWYVFLPPLRLQVVMMDQGKYVVHIPALQLGSGDIWYRTCNTLQEAQAAAIAEARNRLASLVYSIQDTLDRIQEASNA